MSDETDSCCKIPARGGIMPPATAVARGGPRPEDAVEIPGGSALVGTGRPEIPNDGEEPLRRQKVKPFLMGRTAVTNAQFARFVEETGHVTEAERWGWSFVFWAQVPESLGPTQAVAEVQWWRKVDGATWREVNGPGTQDAAWHPDHPVVHVSWNDAQAYAS
ncbi:SUMF1/EgtB/PvdO family nonheme iron enzyme, partial [Cribrihabitans sp. XS_ASV171]